MVLCVPTPSEAALLVQQANCPKAQPPVPPLQAGRIAKLIGKPGTGLGLEGTYAGCHSNSTNPCHWRPPYSENSDSKALLAPGWQPVILLSGNRIASLSKTNPAQSYEWKISKGHQSSWDIQHRLGIQQSQPDPWIATMIDSPGLSPLEKTTHWRSLKTTHIGFRAACTLCATQRSCSLLKSGLRCFSTMGNKSIKLDLLEWVVLSEPLYKGWQ